MKYFLLVTIAACLGILTQSSASDADVITTYLREIKELESAMKYLNESMDEDAERWQEIEKKLNTLTEKGLLKYNNQLLVPDFEMEGIGLLYANNYHPAFQLIDLNKDSRTDFVITAKEYGTRATVFYILVYINKGERLDIALQHRTVIEGATKKPEVPEYSFLYIWNAKTKSYDISTWESKCSDIWKYGTKSDIWKWDTKKVVFRLSHNGVYKKG